MRRATRGLVYFVLIVAALILGTLAVVQTQSERIAIKIGDLVTGRIGRERNLSIEVGNISGTLLRDIRFEDICITYNGDTAPKILMSASSLYAKFNLAAVLLGRVGFDSVEVVSPRLSIPKRSDGSRIYLSGDPPAGGAGRPFEFGISGVRIRDASIIWEDRRPKIIRHLMMEGSYRQDANASVATVTRSAFIYGDGLTVEDMTGVLRDIGERVEVHNLAIRSEGSRLAMTGFFGKGEGDSISVAAAIDSLDLGEASTVSGKRDQGEIGKIRGRVDITGSRDDIDVEADLEGRAYQWIVEDLHLEGSYGQRRVKVDRLSSRLSGMQLDLSGEYRLLAPPTYEGVIGFSALDLADFIEGETDTYSSDLAGSIRFRGRGVDTEHFRLTTWPNLRAGRYRDWTFDSIRGRVLLDTQSAVLDSVRATVGEAMLDASGSIGFDGETTLGFSLDCPHLEDVYAYHKLDDLKGGLAGSGSLYVHDGSFGFLADSEGENIDYQGTLMDSLVFDIDLRELDERLAGHSQIFASDLDIQGLKASEFIGDITIDDRRLNLERMVLTRADGNLLGLVGHADLLDDGFDLAVSNLFVEMGGLIWENADTIVATLRQDSLSVNDFRLGSDMGRISLLNSSFVKGRYSLETRFEGFDLGLLRDISGKEIPTGMLTMAIAASGTADSISFDMDFTIKDGWLRSVPFEAIGGQLAYDGDTLAIEHLTLIENGGSVEITGFLPTDLSPSRVSRLLAERRAYDIVEDLGQLTITAEGIDISLLETVLPPVATLRGFAGLKMEISGDKRSPRIITSGTLAEALYGSTEIGEVTWDIEFGDSLLRISRLVFGVGDERGEISGEVPMAISIFPFSSAPLEEALDVVVSVENGNLGLVCEIFPKLKVCSGTYLVGLHIGGSVSDPTFSGFVKLVDARLRMEGVAQDLRGINLEVVAEGKRFDLVRMVAEGDALRAGGFFEMEGTRISDWDFSIELDDLAITEFMEFYARVSGNIHVTHERFEPDKPVPKIEGNLTVKEGEYFYRLERGGGGTVVWGPTTSPSWVMNIGIEIPNAFWIRGDDIEAELQGDLNVKKGKEGLVILGTMRTLRGRFYIYHNAFRISRAEFRFADVKTIRNVYIDLEAQSRVLDEKIEIKANGYIDKLNVDPSSESGWSETQIFEALTLRRGVPAEAGTEERFFSGEFLKSWGQAIFNRFGDDVARELNLDQFGVEVGDVGQGDAIAATRVTFGKYVSDKVYLEYTESLGSLYGDRRRFTQMGLSFPERQLSVEYRLSDRFSIEGETGTVGGLGYFDVDLRFRFGY
jgi:hypothetical protein